MQATQHIQSISDLKSHAAQIAQEVENNATPFFITQNGEASRVIESVQPYQEKENLITLLKLIALGEKDRLTGQGHSIEASRVMLAQARTQRSA